MRHRGIRASAGGRGSPARSSSAGVGPARVALAVGEQRRRGRHAGAHAAAEVGGDPLLDRLRAPVGVEARDVEPEALGALPQVRVLEAALVGEQRVVHRPERALRRRRLGRRGGRRGRAGGSRGRGSGGRRRAAAARAGAPRAPRRTGTRSPRRRRPAALPPAPGRDRRGRRAAAVPSRAPLRPAAASSASKIRFAPGRSPGEAASWLHWTTASGPIITSARCGKPPGCSTPNARQAAPLGSKSESWAISMPSCFRNASWEYVGVARDAVERERRGRRSRRAARCRCSAGPCRPARTRTGRRRAACACPRGRRA